MVAKRRQSPGTLAALLLCCAALPQSFGQASEEVIVDETNSAAVTVDGSWTTLSSSSAYQSGYFVGKYSGGANSVTFDLVVEGGKTYDVAIWFYAFPTRDPRVPVTVLVGSSSSSVQVDMSRIANGQQWFSLGSYSVGVGTSLRVRIGTTGTTEFVVADAVRAYYAGVSPSPTPVNPSATPSPSITPVDLASCLCDNCTLGTSGPCRHQNDGHCMPVLSTTQSCPPGADACCFVNYPTPSPQVGGNLELEMVHCPVEGTIYSPLYIDQGGVLIAPCDDCGGEAIFGFAAGGGDLWAKTRCPSTSSNEWTVNGQTWVVPTSANFEWNEFGSVSGSVVFTSLEEGCDISHIYVGSATPDESGSFDLNCVPVDTGSDEYVVASSAGYSSGAPTGDYPVRFTFTFSETPVGFDLDSISPRVNCNNPSLQGSGTQYVLSCFPTDGQEVGVKTTAWTYFDLDGEIVTTASNYFHLIADRTGPTLTISHADVACSRSNPLVLTITGSEQIAGLTLAEVDTTECPSASLARRSASSYTVSCDTSSRHDQLTGVSVNAGAVGDRAGNLNTAAAARLVYTDIVPPTITISSQDHSPFDPISDDPIIFTFQLSEVATDFVQSDITTLENCNNPVFDGSGTTYTLQCDFNPGKLVAVGVGSRDFSDCAGNVNQVGMPYLGFFSFDPDDISPSPTPGLSPTASPSPSTSPCGVFDYYGPLEDTYLPGCADSCAAFATLQEALEHCSSLTICGGVTFSTWSEENFDFSNSPEYQVREESFVQTSEDGEQSWVRQACSSDANTDVISPPAIAADGESYCYDGPYVDTYLPECIDDFCTSFPSLESAQAFCNSTDLCSGVTRTTWGPATEEVPFQPRLISTLLSSPYGEFSYLRTVCV